MSLKILEESGRLYNESGPNAVYDYANKLKITDWRKCNPCNAVVPVVHDTCMCCGNDLTNVVHVTEQDSDDEYVLHLSVGDLGETVNFSAHIIKEPNYPGIRINVNGQLVAIVERSEGIIRTCAYKEGQDEPVIINLKD